MSGKDYAEQLKVSEIREPEIAMRTMVTDDEIRVLGESMAAVGLLQPIGVVKVDGHHVCVWGHRRLLAAKRLKWETIFSTVVKGSPADVVRMRHIENRVREEVNAVDEAYWMAEIMSKQKMTQAEIASLLDVSEPYVCQRVAILRWDNQVAAALAERKISYSVAREIAGIGEEAYRRQCLAHAITHGCSARAAEKWRRDWYLQHGPDSNKGSNGGSASPVGQRPKMLIRCGRCHGELDMVVAKHIPMCETCHTATNQELDAAASEPVGQAPAIQTVNSSSA